MTIREIKTAVETHDKNNKYFFSKSTLKYFGQRLSMFRVSHIGGNDFMVSCPSYDTEGRYMGHTQRIYLADQKKLIYLSEY